MGRTLQTLSYAQKPKEENVILASFHLEDGATVRFQWWERTQHYNVTWQDMVGGICSRFGPISSQNFHIALSKIQQTGTLSKYLAEFERLANRVVGRQEEALIGSLIGGLKDEIGSEVYMFKPRPLKRVDELDKMQDDRLARKRMEYIISSPTSH